MTRLFELSSQDAEGDHLLVLEVRPGDAQRFLEAYRDHLRGQPAGPA